MYKDCLVVFVNNKIGSNNVDEDFSSSLDFIGETVDQLCDYINWNDQGDKEVCQDVCLPSHCCFASVAQNSTNYSCVDSHVKLCAAYALYNVPYNGEELTFLPPKEN